MAVHPDVPGLQVDIIAGVSGAPLHEYVDGEKEGCHCTITRYVEAVPNDEFVVRCIFRADFESGHDVGVRVLVDGEELSFMALNGAELTRNHWTWYIKDIERAYYDLRESCFSQVIEEDDAVPEQSTIDRVKDLEIVSIEFTCTKIRGWRSGAGCEISDPDRGVISENAVKWEIISHTTSLTEPELVAGSGWPITESVGIDRPFATFNFKFLSNAVPKSSNIIPRSPSSITLQGQNVRGLTEEALREHIGITRERLEKLETEHRSRQENTLAIKRKRSSSTSSVTTLTNRNGNEDPDGVITSEKLLRTASAADPEVSDLTSKSRSDRPSGNNWLDTVMNK